MSSEFTYLFLPYSSALHTLELLLWFLLMMAVFGLWLTPGGLAWALSRAQARTRTAIPGPSGLPLLGLALAFTNSLTHRILSTLSHQTSSLIMAFSVGFTPFIISSHPQTAKEILNSSAFADRPVKESAHRLLFHRAMGFAPYGDYWRSLRRISAVHLFSPRRVARFGGTRAEIGMKMVEVIIKKMEVGDGGVEVKNVLHFASLNNVMMSVFGKWYDDDFGAKNGDRVELEGLVREGYELLGIFNWSDHFPFLGWMDLQGVRKRSEKLVGRVAVFVGKIVEEHRRIKKLAAQNHDHDHQHSENIDECFLDVLLDLEEENKLDDSDMIALLWVNFFLSFFNLFLNLEKNFSIETNLNDKQSTSP